MFRSVLIANRGEIACRIIRTAKRLGLRTIAVYSEADTASLHVRQADEAHLIGPAPAAESYLAAEKIIAAAKTAKAECIHPGYGFLSENAAFAEACAAAGIVFVGPPPAAIRAMGLKDRAKALMQKAGVPVVPGYHGERQEPKFLKEKAYEIGYPVMIKAVAGGGGKGMRRVEKHTDFDAALESAQREARSAFGDERVLIEKFVTAPRHIEMQVFADNHGNAIHLNERDCSLQRRHQKVIEEAPAPGMTAEVRAAMGAAAVSAAKAVGYSGAGTIEFIADGGSGLRPDGFWFMEMNTRLQVEHPVTEAVTGLDLVEWQLRVASGENLPLAQQEVPLGGHAVEARLYAEDVEHGFLPSTGEIVALDWPDGEVRIDTGVEQGSAVTPFYDPMIAKLIAHAPKRGQALDALGAALDRTFIAGPRTNAAFLSKLLSAAEFKAGRFDTGFIDRNLAALGAASSSPDHAAIAAGARALLAPSPEASVDTRETPSSPWDVADGFQLGGQRTLTLPFVADGAKAMAQVAFNAEGAAVTVEGASPAGDARVFVAEDAAFVLRHGKQTKVARPDFSSSDSAQGEGGGTVRSPMHGKVLAIFVDKGAEVVKGQRLAIIEAMKMEHSLTAPVAGTVTEIAAAVGAQVLERATILTITPHAET